MKKRKLVFYLYTTSVLSKYWDIIIIFMTVIKLDLLKFINYIKKIKHMHCYNATT